MKFLNARRAAYHTNPRLIDEAIYTTYYYTPSAPADTSKNTPSGDLLGVPELFEDGDNSGQKKQAKKSRFHPDTSEAEVFLFEYGTVVFWGMTEAQEKRFLSSL